MDLENAETEKKKQKYNIVTRTKTESISSLEINWQCLGYEQGLNSWMTIKANTTIAWLWQGMSKHTGSGGGPSCKVRHIVKSFSNYLSVNSNTAIN